MLSSLSATQRARAIVWAPIGALSVLFAVAYGVTLLHGLHEFGDVTKAQFLGLLLGTTHPTGYPLYIALTAPIAHLPLGSLATRINAFSALMAIVTVGLTFGIQRLLGVRPVAAALAAAAFGFSRTFWDQSVIAEVYALNSALFAFVLYALLRWHAEKRTAWFLVACAAYALSFDNHLTMVTCLPAFAFAVFCGDRRVLRDWRTVLAVVGFVVLGVGAYAYPIWRTRAGSLYLEYRVPDLKALLNYVSGDHYRGRMLHFPVKSVFLERLPKLLGQVLRDLGPIALLAPLGALLCKARWATTVLALAALGELLWALSYDIPDVEIYMIPTTLVIAVWVGAALDLCSRHAGWRRWFVLASAAAAVVLLAWLNRPSHAKAEAFAQSIEQKLQGLERSAAVVGIIDYNVRMGLVHRLYAEGLGTERELHLDNDATPASVARYLRGEAALRDSHTRAALPLGLRLFVAPRSEDYAWGGSGLVLLPSRFGLREVKFARP